MLVLMALALALFQRGGGLVPALAGALLFGVLALLRSDLALLFVPLTVPLYLIPAMVPSPRSDAALPLRLPTYEVALLIVFGATAANRLWRRIATTDHRPLTNDQRRKAKNLNSQLQADHDSRIRSYLSRYAPHLLFLLTGVLGVIVAAEPSRALREFRWLIAEPLLFYMLVNIHVAGRRSQIAEQHDAIRQTSQFSMLNAQFLLPLVTAFILSGALVGLIGLLQVAGIDLAGLLGTKQCFAASGAPCDNVVVIGGVPRATSVYGHPNNLGLYLGRVWPLAAALAVTFMKRNGQRLYVMFFALCALCCLGGIVVSFSRGAWLGAVVALAMLALMVAPIKVQGKRQKAKGAFLPFAVYILPLLLLIIVFGLALSLRGNILGGSTPPRLLLWREAVGYIWWYPLGIGLDQFGYYHDPSNQRSLIDPALVGTSEQYAAHPHNELLDAWLRLGPLGVVAFGWLLARFFRRGLGVRREAPAPLVAGALAAMAAALAHGLVDNFYFVPDLALAFWLLLALVEIETEA
jgi:O-antigen ligase